MINSVFGIKVSIIYVYQTFWDLNLNQKKLSASTFNWISPNTLRVEVRNFFWQWQHQRSFSRSSKALSPEAQGGFTRSRA